MWFGVVNIQELAISVLWNSLSLKNELLLFNRGYPSTKYPSRENGILWMAASVETDHYHCIWGFWKIQKAIRNSHWFGRHWFSAKVRKKQGRMLMCWTSKEIPGDVPVILARKGPSLTAARVVIPSTLPGITGEAIAEKGTGLQSPGKVWVPPRCMSYATLQG